MPEEGKVQVVSVTRLFGTNESNNAVIEMGARGQAVELLGVHYTLSNLSAATSIGIEIGLSSNPENEGFPFIGSVTPNFDPSVYGYWDYSILTLTGVGHVVREPQGIIPLYGLVRPRRQVLIFVFNGGTAELRTEVYYRSVSLVKEDLDSLNLKFGKYRRTA